MWKDNIPQTKAKAHSRLSNHWQKSELRHTSQPRQYVPRCNWSGSTHAPLCSQPLQRLIYNKLLQTTASHGQEERMCVCHQSCGRTVGRHLPCKNLPEGLHENSFPPHKLLLSQGRTESFNHNCPRFSTVSFSKWAHSITYVTRYLSDQWTVLNICMWYIMRCKSYVRNDQVLPDLQFAYAILNTAPKLIIWFYMSVRYSKAVSDAAVGLWD